MAVKPSLSQSMDRAVERYSSLFKLPPYRRVIVFSAALCIGGSLLAVTALFPTIDGLINGMLLGSLAFLFNAVFDYVASSWVLKSDLVYDFRRTAALSLYCWFLWFFFIFIGVVAGVFFGWMWWVRLCLLGFSAVLLFRFVIFNSTSALSSGRVAVASLLQPMPCMVPFLILWSRIGYPLTLPMYFYIFFSVAMGLGTSYLFLSPLNRIGEKTLGIRSLTLFKAFLLNWVIGLNAPFEDLLEKLGEERDTEVSLVKFASSKTKTVIAIPSVHPGPFKNIGSSLLPSMLKAALEKQLDCVACIPHGMFGHEVDLASQAQTEKVISHTVDSALFDAVNAKAAPSVTMSNGTATACCQIFGDFALLSFTLAPNTTEDFPPELGQFVRQEAQKLGLRCCVLVNAHNSIREASDMQGVLSSLKDVAVECLRKAVSMKQLAFEVGAATLNPSEFSLEDGMGAGGITAVIVKVGEQKTAYITIDGNNMVSGLREKILSSLQSAGFDAGEVFTTDTHSVNALVLTERGYNPVGETIDHARLIEYVRQVAVVAMKNLELVKSACRSATICGVKVIGERQLETLCELIDRSLRKAKEIVIPIFAGSGLLLMLFLLFV